MYITHYTRQILITLEFPWEIFEKYSNIKFHENSSSGSQDVPRERTDRYEADSWFLQFYKHA